MKLNSILFLFLLVCFQNCSCAGLLVDQKALLAYLTKQLHEISSNEKNYLDDLFSRYMKDRGLINLPGKTCRKIMAKINLSIYYLEDVPSNNQRFLEFNKVLREFLEFFAISKRIIDREANCPICRDNIRDRVRTNCGHYFCKLCLMSWFAGDKARTDNPHSQCPTCRAPFSKRVKRALYTTSGYKRELAINLKKKKEHLEQLELEDGFLALSLQEENDDEDDDDING